MISSAARLPRSASTVGGAWARRIVVARRASMPVSATLDAFEMVDDEDGDDELFRLVSSGDEDVDDMVGL